jgi:cytochrome c oxidase subunit IV
MASEGTKTTESPQGMTVDAQGVHLDEHAHPPDRKYVVIALWLGLLTAFEIALYYFPPGDAEIPLLLILMVIKFFVVAAWFMHLKFDSRIFTRIFVAGLVLAVAVYIAVLLTFRYW